MKVPRPVGITALSIFFLFGATASFMTVILLLLPESFLAPIWRLNPRAHEGLTAIGGWAIVLMCVACVACAAAAVGLWRGLRWGYWLALVLLATNLLADIANVVSGTEPRAAIGIPIALAIIFFLISRRARTFFAKPADPFKIDLA